MDRKEILDCLVMLALRVTLVSLEIKDPPVRKVQLDNQDNKDQQEELESQGAKVNLGTKEALDSPVHQVILAHLEPRGTKVCPAHRDSPASQDLQDQLDCPGILGPSVLSVPLDHRVIGVAMEVQEQLEVQEHQEQSEVLVPLGLPAPKVLRATED